MKPTRTRLWAALALAALLPVTGMAQRIPPAGALRHSDPQARRSVELRLQLPSRGVAWQSPVEHRLAAVRAEALDQARAAAPTDVTLAGLHRAVEESWWRSARLDRRDNGGVVWRAAIASPGAAGLRVHFTGFQAGAGRVWVHDGSGDEAEIHGPYTGQGPHGDGDFWSDVVTGDRLVVEYEPAAEMGPVDAPPFTVTELSHLLGDALPRFAESKQPPRAAAGCNLDVTCHPDWADTARAVAHIVFESGNSSFVCSGTLLNTRQGSRIPYFLTAQHCIANDTVARTVSAFWFYQTSTCNGTPPNKRNVPRTLGARFLAGTPGSSGDFTLLQLNSVPDGVTFSGWDPNPLPPDVAVTGIHHPDGDYKRISFGVSREPTRFSGRDMASFVGSFWSGGGLTEGGSSGSGLFSNSLTLVGALSHGPKANSPAEYCALLPFADNYGRFSFFYPRIRDFLEDRTTNVTPPATTPPPTGGVLTSGQGRSITLGPVTASRLFRGSSGFTIQVPQGATRLDITLRTATAGADVDLYARFGEDVGLEDGRVIADARSEGPAGEEQISISGANLRAGTYFIALGVFTPGVEVRTTVTATVTGGGTAPPPPTTPPAGGNALTSGVARNFTLGPVSSSTLFRGENSFTITVPQGATRLEVTLRSTATADVDLYVRRGQDVALDGSNRVVADFRSDGATSNEQIVVTGADLQPGTYFIAFGLFTTGVSVPLTVTATVTGGGTAPPPPTTPPAGGNALTSGVARNFTLGPVSSSTLFRGENSFTITVPQGATRLEVTLRSTATADVDLYVRRGQDVALDGGRVVADFRSDGATSNEQVVVTGADLQPGTYFIAFGLFTTGVSVPLTVTATVTGGGATTPPPPTPPVPPTGANALTSGVARNFTAGPVTRSTLLTGSLGFTINVPQGSTQLRVTLRSTSEADVDLYLRRGQDVDLENGRVVADFRSDTQASNEEIILSGSQLQPGTYFIGFGVFTTGVAIPLTITATVTSGTAPPPPPPQGTALVSGQTRNFTLGPVNGASLLNSASGYTIVVPQNATRLEITLRTTTPNADVDLYTRFGQDVLLSSGRALADARSDGPTGNEQIVLTGPSLRAGTYFIAFGLFTTGVQVQCSVTATVTTGTGTAPPATGPVTLSSGVGSPFRIERVSSPALLAGNLGFRVQVPQGATRLDLRLVTAAPPNADLDLYARFGSDVSLSAGRPQADHIAESATGSETITILPSSTPALRAGTYFVAIGVFTTDAEITGTITATITMGAAAPPPTAVTPLTSGAGAKFSLPAVDGNTLFRGAFSYRIDVPEGASRLVVRLQSDVQTVDTDLFVRFGADPEVDGDGNVVADHEATSRLADETIVIDAGSSPVLRPGRYFISIGVFTPRTPVTGTITATVERSSIGGASGTSLSSGNPAGFRLPAVSRATLFTGRDGFEINVPEGAAQLEITLRTDPASTDVDLYVRRGAPPEVDANGRVVADHAATTDSGNEQLLIDGGSRPALRPGMYHIGLGLFSLDTPAVGTVTARVVMAGSDEAVSRSGLVKGDGETLYKERVLFRFGSKQELHKVGLAAKSAGLEKGSGGLTPKKQVRTVEE